MFTKKWRPGSLWQNPDFLKLWAGETVSFLGSKITALALPLTAVLTLEATPAQMGILGALQLAPFLLVTLFAGVWIDRRRRRPVLIVANLARAVLLTLVPLGAGLGLLSMQLLYVLGFFMGLFQVFFDLAYQSYLPSLVAPEQLVEGNSKLQMSASAAEIGGPGLAGILVELVTAPIALLVDALTFLASVLGLTLIRKREPAPAGDTERTGLWRKIGEGFRVVFGNPYLRACACEASSYNLCFSCIAAVFLLFVTRELGIGPGLLGIIISTASVGALLGSMSAGWVAKRIGFGRAILLSMVMASVAFLLVPLASGPSPFPVVVLVSAYLVAGYGLAMSNVHVVSLRQVATPDRLLGRMNASYRFAVYGAGPIGSLLGGGLGEVIGLRPTLAVGAIGMLFACLWVLFSPVPRLRQLTDAAPAEGEPVGREAVAADSAE